MKRQRGEEDEMLKYRRKARIALAVELFGFSSGCWRCAECQDEGDLMEEMEMEDDSRKLKS